MMQIFYSSAKTIAAFLDGIKNIALIIASDRRFVFLAFT